MTKMKKKRNSIKHCDKFMYTYKTPFYVYCTSNDSQFFTS
jgi:hypothetical protein